MAKVGYIFNSEQYDTFTFDRAWMERYGCCRIIEDSASQEKTRPEWKQLIDCLERGDELVISKFSNELRGVRELAMFLEFCRANGKYARKYETSAAILCLCYKKLYICKARK